MDCREARQLLDRGVTPGPRPAERAALGFHLAGCAACRAYQDARRNDLLAQLLSATPAVAPAVAPAVEEAPAAVAAPGWRERWLPPPGRLSTWLWYGGVAALGLILIVLLGSIATALLSVYRIHENYQSFYVPPAQAAVSDAATPAPSPTAAPSATPAPSPTTAPSATPLPSATPPPTATPLPTATPEPTPEAGGAVTVLLLGSDRRPDEQEPSRTDAIIIARVDPARKRIALLSLPRDLVIDIPGYGAARINAANVYGYTGEPGSGAERARQAVSNLLGIPIDHYIYIDFQGFIGAIDSLGGVPVDVPTELYDPEFPTMDYGYTEAHFVPGREVMDGARALMYSRIRHPDSDFARMRRQQSVLVGVLNRLREGDAATSLKRLADVSDSLRGFVRTDIPEKRMLGLAWALRDIAPDTIERYELDENMVAFGIGSDRWAESALPGTIEELTQKLIGQ